MIKVRNELVTFMPPENAAYLIGDFTDWKQRPLPLQGAFCIEFPRGAYVEYAFLDVLKRPLADETNPSRPKSPWHEYDRSITLAHNAFKEPPHPTVFRGSIQKHTLNSQYLAIQQTYYVYKPPQEPKVTIYVHDGEGFYERLQFHHIAEALLERGEIEPLRIVFIVPRHREVEYRFNKGYENFLLKELMAQVKQHYGETQEHALWGASLGGLVSAWLAWRNPTLFTKVGSMSGCFKAYPEGNDEFRDPEWLTEQLVADTCKGIRFYVQTGQIEWLLAPNRRFAAMLKDRGYPHQYEELPSGHNWATWEQGLEPGLKYLFGK